MIINNCAATHGGEQCENHWLYLQRLKSERHPAQSGVE